MDGGEEAAHDRAAPAVSGESPFDPVAWEKRLQVARAQRAAAFARRNETQPAPPQPPSLRQAAPEPPVAPDPSPPPARGAADPAPTDVRVAPAPAADTTGGGRRRLAGFAAAFLAGIAAAILAGALLRRGPEPTQPPAALARVDPAPLPTTPPPTAAPDPAAEAPAVPGAAVPEPAPNLPAAADRAPSGPPPVARPAAEPPAVAAPPAVAEPMEQAEARPLVAPLPHSLPPGPPPLPPASLTTGPSPAAEFASTRVTLHAPSALPIEPVAEAARAVTAAGFAAPAEMRIGLSIARTHVRFYHPADAAAAAALAAAVPGGPVEVRDFTAAARRAQPGAVELWLAGKPRVAARTKPRRARQPASPERIARDVMRQVEGTVRNFEQILGNSLDRVVGAP